MILEDSTKFRTEGRWHLKVGGYSKWFRLYDELHRSQYDSKDEATAAARMIADLVHSRSVESLDWRIVKVVHSETVVSGIND